VCLQLGEAELVFLTVTGESLYKRTAFVETLGSRSMDKTQAQLQESLPNEGGAVSSASSNENASSLVSVSTQLEAVRLNRMYTIQLSKFL
jgi:hypothetical protein